MKLRLVKFYGGKEKYNSNVTIKVEQNLIIWEFMLVF